jgi:hypothetical protein
MLELVRSRVSMSVCSPLLRLMGALVPFPCVTPTLSAGKLPRRWRRSSGRKLAEQPSFNIASWHLRASAAKLGSFGCPTSVAKMRFSWSTRGLHSLRGQLVYQQRNKGVRALAIPRNVIKALIIKQVRHQLRLFGTWYSFVLCTIAPPSYR